MSGFVGSESFIEHEQYNGMMMNMHIPSKSNIVTLEQTKNLKPVKILKPFLLCLSREKGDVDTK